MKQVYFLIIATLITSITFVQNTEDTTTGQLHDDLLNHLVGNWNITSVAHGFSSSSFPSGVGVEPTNSCTIILKAMKP
jgi:hypothetical protein